MFERFSGDARATVVEAQTHARERGDDAIDAVHLLVALAHQPGGVAASALAAVVGTSEAVDRHAAALGARDDVDRPALASLGIELDADRARQDAEFGARPLARRPPTRRGPLPFTK